MKCPHCNHTIHSNQKYTAFTYDKDCHWRVVHEQCPECQKVIIYISRGKRARDAFTEINRYLVYPRKIGGRSQAPSEVPQHIAEDYNEAGVILNYSPKASAALSRRCLQTILRETDGIKNGTLDSEINQALKLFPPYIGDAIDAIRNIGDFVAHPKKSTSAGEIVAVEPGEAEWALEVLEQLFDFCYVQPKKLKEKQDTLHKKLVDINKLKLKIVDKEVDKE